jgi:hypothetical protein
MMLDHSKTKLGLQAKIGEIILNKDQFDNTTSKPISLNWPTVNPYAGLQVAGLVIGNFYFSETEVLQANVAMEKVYKICLK